MLCSNLDQHPDKLSITSAAHKLRTRSFCVFLLNRNIDRKGPRGKERFNYQGALTESSVWGTERRQVNSCGLEAQAHEGQGGRWKELTWVC